MIRGFPDTPDPLRKKGYTVREEQTAFLEHRDVYCSKRIGRVDSDLVFDIQIRYELAISDSPYGKSKDNFSYFPSTITLIVWKKTGEEDSDGLPVLEKIGESELFTGSLVKLERFAASLGSTNGWRYLPD
jgi:hypothetical protein